MELRSNETRRPNTVGSALKVSGSVESLLCACQDSMKLACRLLPAHTIHGMTGAATPDQTAPRRSESRGASCRCLGVAHVARVVVEAMPHRVAQQGVHRMGVFFSTAITGSRGGRRTPAGPASVSSRPGMVPAGHRVRSVTVPDPGDRRETVISGTRTRETRPILAPMRSGWPDGTARWARRCTRIDRPRRSPWA